jgi:hypothetical protein
MDLSVCDSGYCGPRCSLKAVVTSENFSAICECIPGNAAAVHTAKPRWSSCDEVADVSDGTIKPSSRQGQASSRQTVKPSSRQVGKPVSLARSDCDLIMGCGERRKRRIPLNHRQMRPTRQSRRVSFVAFSRIQPHSAAYLP